MELRKEIENSFPNIEKLFTEETLLKFAYTVPDDLEEYNWGLGTIIRLKLLSPKSKLYRAFIQNGVTDRDKMAMEVIKEFHEYIQREI